MPWSTAQDLGKTAKGYVADATGHVTIVVDKNTRELLGAFIAGPGASEAIHEAVLAIKTGTSHRRPGRHAPRVPDDGPCAGHGLHGRGEG